MPHEFPQMSDTWSRTEPARRSTGGPLQRRVYALPGFFRGMQSRRMNRRKLGSSDGRLKRPFAFDLLILLRPAIKIVIVVDRQILRAVEFGGWWIDQRIVIPISVGLH